MITSFKPNLAIVQPQGGLDQHSGTALRQALCELCPERFSCWVIDLSNVDFINSAGLSALVTGLHLAQAQACRFAIHNPHPSVKLVFEITRLDELFEVIETLEAEHELAPDLDREASIAHAA